MSVDARPRYFRQRRLGILRSSQPPRTRAASTGMLDQNLLLNDYHHSCDLNNASSNNSFESEEVYQEKLRRLHQIRSDNAITKMRAQSCSELKRRNNVIHDVCSLRCSTAPSYGTVRQFLKDKIFHLSETDTDSVFEDNSGSPTPLSLKGRRRNRLSSFPSINSVQNYTNLPQVGKNPQSPKESNDSVYLSSQPYSNDVSGVSIKSITSNVTSQKLRRSSSAPAEVYRNSLIKEEDMMRRTNQQRARQHTYSSLVKNDSKRPVRTPTFRHASLFRQSSRAFKIPSPNDPQVKMDGSPLGIVGEPCKSNKPPNFVRPIYKLPLRRSGLPISIKISSKLPTSPLNIDACDAKPVCVIPNQSSGAYVGCTCRSVRFNCTDNLVYEYLSNDPVAQGAETIKKVT